MNVTVQTTVTKMQIAKIPKEASYVHAKTDSVAMERLVEVFKENFSLRDVDFELDNDECQTGEHNCESETEICVNNKGSFQCECKEGLYREGETCVGCVATLETNGKRHIISRKLIDSDSGISMPESYRELKDILIDVGSKVNVQISEKCGDEMLVCCSGAYTSGSGRRSGGRIRKFVKDCKFYNGLSLTTPASLLCGIVDLPQS